MTKTVNFTTEQTTELVAAYTDNPTQDTVTDFAEKFGKSVASIRAKLAKEGVYVAKTKEASKRTATKAELVEQIAKLVCAEVEQVESLEKATLPALTMVLDTLRAYRKD